MKKRLVVVFLLMLSVLAMANSKHILTVDDLFAMGRVGSPAVSADGKWAAYTVTEYSMADNKSSRDIWLTALDGSDVHQLTQDPATDFAPAWNPTDSNELAFISTRDGSAQIYLMNIKTAEIRQLTSISTGASGPLWSPDGTAIAFVSDVYPDLKTDAENAARNADRDTSLVKARVIDHLLYRHWNSWKENKRSHVFVADAKTGDFQDKTPGDFDSPPISLGGAMDYAFSSNSETLAFVRNTDPMVAISTNNDVFTVALSGGAPTRMTPNPALDVNPVYSPNGKYLFYLAMARPAFEADQQDIMRLNLKTGERINLTGDFDRSVNQLLVSPNSKFLYFTAFDYGRDKIYTMPVKVGAVKVLVNEHDNSGICLTADGKNLVFRRQAANMPHEIFNYNLKKKSVTQLTFTNQERLANLEMNPVEDFEFTSFDGWKVHGLLVKPPFFDPAKKYPMIYLIHGGPQGGWSDDFHFRWNSQMFAAPGYVVALVNFRGSRGYGQEFCDAVSKNWGGGPYQDLMTGLDYLLETYDFIDGEKLAAAGASYGGYMINWIATQNDRFKALVSHAGAFDLRSKYGSTEELWFPEWEFGGTPYEQPELYEKWSPSYFAGNLKKYQVPTLVIHGALDYRVPEAQGFQMFTALQRNGVPSRFLYFPDEDHFIRKPQNARLWWTTLHAWIAEWIEK